MITVETGTKVYAEEMCALVRTSITVLCTLDHNNDKQTLSDWLENKTTENFRSWIDNNTSFVAFDQDWKIVGVCLLSPDGWILLNYVSPQYYNKGVGKLLLHEMESCLCDGSIVKTRSTKSALGFYHRCGFVAANPDEPLCLEKKVRPIKRFES